MVVDMQMLVDSLMGTLLCEPARAAVTKCYKIGTLHNRDSLSHSPGGLKLETKVWTVQQRIIYLCLSLSFWWFADHHWLCLIDALPKSLLLCSHGVLSMCVCVQISPFYKDTCHSGLRKGHPNPV